MAAPSTSQVSAWQALLAKTPVSSLSKPKNGVISIDSTTPLNEAFQSLLSNQILSAPVYDASSKKYSGFLDVRDLVSFVVFVYDEQKVQDNQTLQDIIKHGVKMFATPTTDGVTVTYLSRRHRFLPVSPKDNLSKVTSILVHKDVHRVPVVDENGKLVNIISQSSIVQFLHSHLPSIASYMDKKVSSLSVGTAPVDTVDKGTSVIDTLRLMDNKKRSGMAIVDGTKGGKLVGTTTGKDLKLFMERPTLAALRSPVFDFLNAVRSESIDIKAPTIAVFQDDTLGLVVGKLAATRVHRIWVVKNEDEYKPLRVISVADILQYLNGQKE